jgi:hypothetical protein
MRARTFTPGHSLRIAAVTALAALILLVPGSLAQTPVGEEAAGEAHPAHIHTGACDQLGGVVAPLTDVAAAAGEMVGSDAAFPVESSITTVDMPLQEIISGGHAINVHQSVEAIDVYVACGDIGGAVTTSDDGRESLFIGLGELNDSGYTGVAWLGADGEQTDVSIVLTEIGAAGGAAGTPVSGAADAAHPAHIHTGTCTELGEVAYPLTDVAAVEGETMGPESAHLVESSISAVDAPLEALLDGNHALNVHLSGEEIGTYIACGDIGGTLVTDEDGRSHLFIGLGELNGSGYTGVAWLGADGEETEVSVRLIKPGTME